MQIATAPVIWTVQTRLKQWHIINEHIGELIIFNIHYPRSMWPSIYEHYDSNDMMLALASVAQWIVCWPVN